MKFSKEKLPRMRFSRKFFFCLFLNLPLHVDIHPPNFDSALFNVMGSHSSNLKHFYCRD